jgi:tRNA/tmRNA/rRNA uracil-C5-methylase (TrmA/RlmC/RlmD family)
MLGWIKSIVLVNIMFGVSRLSLSLQTLPRACRRTFSLSSTATSVRPKLPAPIACEEVIELQIDDLSNLGMGVGRKNFNGTNWVIMVPRVLSGELVKVQIKRNFAAFSEATLLEVLKASADRVKPPCKYFNSCGGCQYQQMNIESQRKWKTSQVAAAMKRIAKIDDIVVNNIVGAEPVYHYRSKITPHYKVIKDNKYSSMGTREMNVGFQMSLRKTIYAEILSQPLEIAKLAVPSALPMI